MSTARCVAGVNVRGFLQTMDVVAGVERPERKQLGHVAAAGAAQQRNRRRVAVPLRGVRLDPAETVTHVLHGARVGRLGVPKNTSMATTRTAPGREPLVHQLVGGAVLAIPGAAVHIDQHGKRAWPLRLANPSFQGPNRVASILVARVYSAPAPGCTSLSFAVMRGLGATTVVLALKHPSTWRAASFVRPGPPRVRKAAAGLLSLGRSTASACPEVLGKPTPDLLQSGAAVQGTCCDTSVIR